jgi:hypothetical protein
MIHDDDDDGDDDDDDDDDKYVTGSNWVNFITIQNFFVQLFLRFHYTNTQINSDHYLKMGQKN